MEFDREYRKIMEAISLGDAKKHKLSKKHSGAYGEVLDEVFGGKNRIIMPLNIDYSTIDNAHLLFLKINEFLGKHGYSVETLKDYIDGKAVKFKVDSDGKHIYDNKNPVKIGKLLQKFEEDGEIEVMYRKDGLKTTKKVVGKPLLHEFKNDPLRAANGEFLIVISRHPYDVAGSSTDRSWTSCMDLGLDKINYPNKEKRKGVNSEYVKSDITEGTLVAYVITKDELFKGVGGVDKVKIRKPLSRILIKPHDSDVGKLYTIGKMYGSNYPEFYQRIQEWISETLNVKAKNVKDVNAKRNVNLYPDYDTPVGFEMKSLNNVIGILRKRASRISKRFKNSNVGVVYDAEEDENFYHIWITFKYDISKCNIPKEFKIAEKMLEQIENIFDPGDFYIRLDRADIFENTFNVVFELEDEDLDNIKQGMYRLGQIEQYLEWIEQNVDPEICEIMQELGVNSIMTRDETPLEVQNKVEKFMPKLYANEAVEAMDIVYSEYKDDLSRVPVEIIKKIATSPSQSVIFSKMLINSGIIKIPQPILNGIKSDEKYVDFFLKRFRDSISPVYVHFLNNESTLFDKEYQKLMEAYQKDLTLPKDVLRYFHVKS